MDIDLISLFRFTKPIRFEENVKGIEDYEVIAKSNETIIKKGRQPSIAGLLETLALAKLAERDPLLVTFAFESGANENTASEDEFLFYAICQPLRDAWSYKIMREYVPELYDVAIDFYSTVLKEISDSSLNIKELGEHLGIFCFELRCMQYYLKAGKLILIFGCKHRMKTN